MTLLREVFIQQRRTLVWNTLYKDSCKEIISKDCILFFYECVFFIVFYTHNVKNCTTETSQGLPGLINLGIIAINMAIITKTMIISSLQWYRMLITIQPLFETQQMLLIFCLMGINNVLYWGFSFSIFCFLVFINC